MRHRALPDVAQFTDAQLFNAFAEGLSHILANAG